MTLTYEIPILDLIGVVLLALLVIPYLVVQVQAWNQQQKWDTPLLPEEARIEARRLTRTRPTVKVHTVRGLDQIQAFLNSPEAAHRPDILGCKIDPDGVPIFVVLECDHKNRIQIPESEGGFTPGRPAVSLG